MDGYKKQGATGNEVCSIFKQLMCLAGCRGKDDTEVEKYREERGQPGMSELWVIHPKRTAQLLQEGMFEKWHTAARDEST